MFKNQTLTAAAIAQAEDDLVGAYLLVSTAVVAFFDFVITFSQEVEVVWRRKWTSITWLHAAARWSLLVASVISLTSPTTPQSCVATIIVEDALSTLQYLVFALFSALRVYALSLQNLSLSCLVLMLTLLPFCLNIYSFTLQTIVTSSGFCTSIQTAGASWTYPMPLIARITSIAADLVILLVAWYTTYNTRKAARGSDLKAPLTTLLVRDGTFYFVILLILNIFTMFQNSSSIILNNVPLLLQPMTMIIVYRFILNLRLIDSREEYDTSARYSTVRFMNSAMMVGNMAEPLHVNDDPQEDYGGPSAVEEPSQSEEIATNTSS